MSVCHKFLVNLWHNLFWDGKHCSKNRKQDTHLQEGENLFSRWFLGYGDFWYDKANIKLVKIMRKKPCLRPCAGWKPNKSRAQGNALGTMSPFPTPCKGKSKSQPFAHTFALTGRGRLYIDTQGVALGYELVALSGRSFSRFVRLSCTHAFPPCYLLKTAQRFFYILNTLPAWAENHRL